MENNSIKSLRNEDNLNNLEKITYNNKIESDILLNENNIQKNKSHFFLRLSKPLKTNEYNKTCYKKYFNLTKKQRKRLKEVNAKIKENLKIKNSKKENIYKNFLPIQIWNKYEKLYEKYKKQYKPLIKYRNAIIKERKKQKSVDNLDLYNYKKYKKNKQVIISRNIDLSNRQFSKNDFDSYDKKEKNFNNSITLINNGLNYFIKKTSFLSKIDYKDIKQNLLIDKNNNFFKVINKKFDSLTDKRKFPYLFKVKHNSALINKSNTNIKNFYKSKNFYNNQVEVSFYTSKMTKPKEKEKDKIENININSENLYFKDMSNICENIKNTTYNFFHIENALNVKGFHIIGVTSGDGKKAVLISRKLKNLLIEYFTNNEFYLNYCNFNSKSIFNKELIYEILSSNSNLFIRNILNEICEELKIEGYKDDGSKEIFFLIFMVGVNIISVKAGNIYSYWIYEKMNFSIYLNTFEKKF